jgi:hypothetical protein
MRLSNVPDEFRRVLGDDGMDDTMFTAILAPNVTTMYVALKKKLAPESVDAIHQVFYDYARYADVVTENDVAPFWKRGKVAHSQLWTDVAEWWQNYPETEVDDGDYTMLLDWVQRGVPTPFASYLTTKPNLQLKSQFAVDVTNLYKYGKTSSGSDLPRFLRNKTFTWLS